VAFTPGLSPNVLKLLLKGRKLLKMAEAKPTPLRIALLQRQQELALIVVKP
jgi:hypothetical protein